MAIIYTYPQINSSSDLAASDLMIISDMSANGRPTKSLTLKNLADFITTTGTGTGTTNAIIKWSDGPGGLLGDSIMTENATQIDLAGTFLSTSSPTGTSGPIHGIRANQTSTATGAFNIALYGDSKHTGTNKGSYNYGLYTKAEFEGTNGYDGVLYGAYTEARYDGSGTNATWSSLYGAQAKARVTATATGDLGYMIGNNISSVMDTGTAVDVEFLQGQHTNVTFNSGNVSGSIAVNLLDFDYPGGGTLQGDFAYLQIQNDPVPTPVTGTARAINSDSTLPSHFSGDVEIPLVPTANTHATSKQYVDQQIASIPAGLVFQGNWNASTNTPTLASGTGTVGNYYVVSVAGNTNLDGITDWEVGDWAVFVEVGGVDKWDKIDQTFVQGAGATGQVSFWNGVNSVTGDNDLYWDNANKRLGIGTTSPDSLLEIASGTTTDFLKLTSTGSSASPSKIIFEKSATEQGIVEYVRNGDLRIYNTDSDGGVLIDGSSASGNDLYVKNDGNVGIGTTSPGSKLEINAGSADGVKISAANAATEFVLNAATSNGTSRLWVGGTGNVGIGTTSPDKKLDLTVDTSDDGIILQTVSGRKSLEMFVDNGTNGQGKIHFYTGANLLHGRIMADTSGLNITQLAADKDIIFKADDGSGGNTEYFRVDGSSTDVRFSKNTRHLDNVRAEFGSSGNFVIKHDGADTLLQNGSSGGNLTLQVNEDDHDMIFKCDDGSGGITTYFFLDGSSATTQFYKTLKLYDAAQLYIGDDNDLRLYHNGTNSNIENFTGTLQIIQNLDDGDISFKSDDGSGGVAEYFRVDGSSVLNIFSKDIRLMDSVRLNMGDQNDLHLRHNGTNGFITNSTGNLYITNESDNEDIIFRCDDGAGGVATYFYLDGSLTTVTPRTVFPDDSVLGFGTGADLQIYHDGTTSNIANYTNNLSIINHFNDGDIKFFSDDGSGGVTEYFRVDGGYGSPQTIFPDNSQLNFGNSLDLRIVHDSGVNKINSVNGELRIIQNEADSDIRFYADNGSGTSTEYFRLDGSTVTTVVSKEFKFEDNVKANFGTGVDLQIYHDGSNSFISDTGTGDIYIEGTQNVFIRDNASGNTWFQGNQGGVNLRYQGNKKIETTNTGIQVTGQMDLAALNTPVTNSDDNGNVGEIRFTADYIYVCVADDTWKRVALSTW